MQVINLDTVLKKIHAVHKLAILSALFMSTVFITDANADGLAPPPYSVKNRHEVDVMSLQVSTSLTDLKIGGNLGLSHTISTHTSSFVNVEGGPGGSSTPWGYREKFNGGIYKAGCCGSGVNYYLRAFDDDSSTDFIINPDGNTYTALKDQRYTLKFVNTQSFMGFVYIKPDGTEVYYRTTISDHDYSSGRDPGRWRMSQIKYPNGLTVDIVAKWPLIAGIGDPVGSVTTNTGFHLKYIHLDNNKTSYDQSLGAITLVQGIEDAPAANSKNWSDTMPKYIMAINSAIDFCTTLKNNSSVSQSSVISTACPNLTKPWPIVSYDWPDGMPRIVYKQPASFKVTDAEGSVTEYIHSPYNAITTTSTPPAYATTPRLTQIKINNKPMINYNYKTEPAMITPIDVQHIGGSIFFWPDSAIAHLISSTKTTNGGETISYVPAHPNRGTSPGGPGDMTSLETDSSGYHTVNRTVSNPVNGLKEVDSWDMSVTLADSPSNQVLSSTKKEGGLTTTYNYARGNLTQTTIQTAAGNITEKAEYPVNCAADDSDRKTCNQAIRRIDARGNVTDYEYDLASGQPTKVTLPADKNGIRPETRYEYDNYYAYYKQLDVPSSTVVIAKAATPLRLLKRESKCQKSAARKGVTPICTDGVNDEIVTEYYYGPQPTEPTVVVNNLFLRGVRVKAKGSKGLLETRLTCYQYDVYGNRIGEKKPKAQASNTDFAVCN